MSSEILQAQHITIMDVLPEIQNNQKSTPSSSRKCFDASKTDSTTEQVAKLVTDEGIVQPNLPPIRH